MKITRTAFRWIAPWIALSVAPAFGADKVCGELNREEKGFGEHVCKLEGTSKGTVTLDVSETYCETMDEGQDYCCWGSLDQMFTGWHLSPVIKCD
jgi:hypothetical protein